MPTGPVEFVQSVQRRRWVWSLYFSLALSVLSVWPHRLLCASLLVASLLALRRLWPDHAAGVQVIRQGEQWWLLVRNVWAPVSLQANSFHTPHFLYLALSGADEQTDLLLLNDHMDPEDRCRLRRWVTLSLAK